MIENEKLPPADEGRLDLRVVPLVDRLRRWPDLPGLHLDQDLMREAADEIERLLTVLGKIAGCIANDDQRWASVQIARDALRHNVLVSGDQRP